MSAHPGKTADLYHMIYASSATVRLSQSGLLELLKISRRNNEARGLTGMLFYRDGMYMQFLEGQRSDIAALAERLRQDTRHKGIQTLREGVLPERLFPDWSMAYKNLVGLRTSNVPGYSERLQAQYVNKGGEFGKSRRESPAPDAVELLTEMFRQLLIAR